MGAESVEWLAGAEADLDALFAARLESSEHSAMELLAMVERALSLLRVFPELGSLHARRFRRFLLQERHLAIFYTFEGRRIFIHAVCDLRQDPDWLRRRFGI